VLSALQHYVSAMNGCHLQREREREFQSSSWRIPVFNSTAHAARLSISILVALVKSEFIQSGSDTPIRICFSFTLFRPLHPNALVSKSIFFIPTGLKEWVRKWGVGGECEISFEEGALFSIEAGCPFFSSIQIFCFVNIWLKSSYGIIKK
jgi:hypothetical protein